MLRSQSRPISPVSNSAASTGALRIGIETFVVTQHTPRQSAIFVADAEETTKGHYRIRDLSGTLVDHHPLDRPEFVSIAAANRRAFDLVTRDQASSLPG